MAAGVISAGVALAKGDYAGAALSLLGPAGRFAKAAYGTYKAGKVASTGTSLFKAVKKTIVNGNNTLGIGKSGGNFRVSIGAQQKHWKKMGKMKKQLYRLHIHVDKRKGGIDWNTKKATPWTKRLYGDWN